MGLFDLFRSKEQVEPLLEMPKADEPIQFDEQEKAAIRAGWPSTLRDTGDAILMDDGTVAYEGAQAENFRRVLAAGGVETLAREKFQRGDLKGAASTCLRAIALWDDDFNIWLLLAELHAANGDFKRAELFLRAAEQAARRVGVRRDSPLWKPLVDQLRAQIKARRYTGLPSAGQLSLDHLGDQPPSVENWRNTERAMFDENDDRDETAV